MGNLNDLLPDITKHAEVCGPMKTQTYGGKNYFLTLTTTPQRYVRVHFLNARTDVIEHFSNFVAWLERSTKKRLNRSIAITQESFHLIVDVCNERELQLRHPLITHSSQMVWLSA